MLWFVAWSSRLFQFRLRENGVHFTTAMIHILSWVVLFIIHWLQVFFLSNRFVESFGNGKWCVWIFYVYLGMMSKVGMRTHTETLYYLVAGIIAWRSVQLQYNTMKLPVLWNECSALSNQPWVMSAWTNPAQGSTLRKNFTSPAGLVTVTFTSPEIFLLALKIDDIKWAWYPNNFSFNINY